MKKVQVVTGGGSGMGLEAAKVLGQYGPVLIGGRTVKKLEGAMGELKALGIEAVAQACDVSGAESVKAFAQRAAAMGEIGNVVHAAGVAPAMTTAENILAINMRGTVNVVEAFYPLLTKGSVLVNIASMAGHMFPLNEGTQQLFADPYKENLTGFILGALNLESNPGLAYCVSKRFVMYFTAQNTLRFSQKGARIVSISPGTFDTDMMAGEESTAQIVKDTPVGRVGDPREIAALIDFLCGDKGGFITGCDILIDGGYSTKTLCKQL